MPSLGTSLSAHQIFLLLSEVRRTKPLVHNITNFVAMNFSANALLAVGASPVMAHAQDEMQDLLSMARALVINIGTLDSSWVASMRRAISAAKEYRRPIVLDPVGAGATKFRTQVARELAESAPLAVIRANASEIFAMSGMESRTKGVDSQETSSAARSAARDLSARYDCVVCVSGEVDYVVDHENTVALSNGHPLMARVTAMGCAASSLIGAFLAVRSDAFQSTQAAMAIMSIAGELAAQDAQGPGSFQIKFLDALDHIELKDLSARLRLTAEV